MAAAASGSARVLRAILDKANIADELMLPIRMHALHEAAKNGHLEVIQVRLYFNHAPQNALWDNVHLVLLTSFIGSVTMTTEVGTNGATTLSRMNFSRYLGHVTVFS